MLVVTAGVFVRTLQQAARIDPGFDTADIVLANVDVSLAGYRDQTAVDLVQRYHTRIQSVNGVVSVAAARMIPLQGSGFGLGRMRIVDGRGLRATDHGAGARVAVVHESFARAAWPAVWRRGSQWPASSSARGAPPPSPRGCAVCSWAWARWIRCRMPERRGRQDFGGSAV